MWALDGSRASSAAVAQRLLGWKRFVSHFLFLLLFLQRPLLSWLAIWPTEPVVSFRTTQILFSRNKRVPNGKESLYRTTSSIILMLMNSTICLATKASGKESGSSARISRAQISQCDRYICLYIAIIISTLTYVADLWTAGILLIFDVRSCLPLSLSYYSHPPDFIFFTI